MIKINLLPQRKPKRQADPGQRDLSIGVLALLVVGAATFFLVHKPKADRLEELQAANAAYDEDLARRKAKIRELPALRSAVALAEERTASIDKLIAARAVPGHMMHELGELLTPGRLPTMTKDMAKKVSDPKDDTYRIREDWDPKHLWVTELREDQGFFSLSGGAESDADVTQLSKRMQASVYFDDVVLAKGEKVTDDDTGITYYTFLITGKVVY
jgi:Tfp pilus assembly protein PilN